MTDPVAPVATAGPVPTLAPAATPPASGPPAPIADPPARSTPPAAAPPPITWNATREGDIFVYTLRDPATDTVLAVIPHEEVAPGRDGRNLDQRV